MQSFKRFLLWNWHKGFLQIESRTVGFYIEPFLLRGWLACPTNLCLISQSNTVTTSMALDRWCVCVCVCVCVYTYPQACWILWVWILFMLFTSDCVWRDGDQAQKT